MMLTCAFALTACGQEEVASSTQLAKQSNAEAISENVVRLVAALVTSQEDISSVFDEYENVELADVFSSMYASYVSSSGISCEGSAVRNAFSTFESGIEDVGGIVTLGDPTSTYDDDSITVEMAVTGSDGTGYVELIFTNDIYLTMTSCTFNVDKTMGQLMGRAALNTLIGMGTVFVVLILISFIIYLFKFIPVIQAKFSKKDESAAAVQPQAAVPQVEAAVEADEDELAGDEELAAVIAAAIAAYEGTSADGFRVRSIKHSNAGKWKRA